MNLKTQPPTPHFVFLEAFFAFVMSRAKLSPQLSPPGGSHWFPACGLPGRWEQDSLTALDFGSSLLKLGCPPGVVALEKPETRLGTGPGGCVFLGLFCLLAQLSLPGDLFAANKVSGGSHRRGKPLEQGRTENRPHRYPGSHLRPRVLLGFVPPESFPGRR